MGVAYSGVGWSIYILYVYRDTFLTVSSHHVHNIGDRPALLQMFHKVCYCISPGFPLKQTGVADSEGMHWLRCPATNYEAM